MIYVSMLEFASVTSTMVLFVLKVRVSVLWECSVL